MMLEIRFLDRPDLAIPVCDVPMVHVLASPNGMEAYDTTAIQVSWGDRACRKGDMGKMFRDENGRIEMIPPTVYPQHDTVVDGAEIARVQSLVDKAWRSHPEVPAAIESYRLILQEISDEYDAVEHRGPEVELGSASRVLGRRRTCSRAEMASIIEGCEPVDMQDIPAPKWAEMCKGITLISVTSGCVRYDQPGQLPGGKCATLMFFPVGLQVQRHWADRIIGVRD